MKRPNPHRNDTDPIANALGQLCEELKVVRQVLDEILCEIQWANRNRSFEPPEPPRFRRITSISADAAASDWPVHVNRYQAEDPPDYPRGGGGTTQGTLF